MVKDPNVGQPITQFIAQLKTHFLKKVVQKSVTGSVKRCLIRLMKVRQKSKLDGQTLHKSEYAGEIETQCKPEYVSKCKHVYKTGYKKYCTTVHDEECRISYATSFKTVYDKKCSTHYEKSCHDVGYGYHKELRKLKFTFYFEEM